MQPVEGLNKNRSTKKAGRAPLTETEVTEILLAAQEMAPGEVGGLVQHTMERLPAVSEKAEDTTDYRAFFAGMFFALTWLIVLPWWAFYLFTFHDLASEQWAAVFISVWAASILAAIATFLKRRFS